MSVKSILGHFWGNWNEWNSNPGGIHHLSFLAEDGIFGPPKGAWFTMMEDDNHLVPVDLDCLDWCHSNFPKNALIST